MGRLGSLIFLICLAASAAKLPKLLPSSQNVFEYEQGLAAPPRFQELDEESKVFLEESLPTIEVQMNPLIGKLLQSSRRQEAAPIARSAAFWKTFEKWLNKNKDSLAGWAWRLPAAALISGSLFYIIGFKGASRSCILFCYSLERKWLFFLSLSAAALFIIRKTSLWEILPAESWSVSIVAVLACAVLLRMLDKNYPVWNATVKSFFAPIASCIIVSFWNAL